mgnify:CR=1 FL=1
MLFKLANNIHSVSDNDYFNSGEDEFDDVDAHETHIPIDKIEQYILSDNSYTRWVLDQPPQKYDNDQVSHS